MAPDNYNRVIPSEHEPQTKSRSALGTGVTTLVTIIVVLLLAAFAVLSLVSARSNLRLSEMVVEQAASYYTADGEATVWYATLDSFVASLSGSVEEYEAALIQAGYETMVTEDGELRVSESFSINQSRWLMVTVTVNDDKTTTIRQWQS